MELSELMEMGVELAREGVPEFADCIQPLALVEDPDGGVGMVMLDLPDTDLAVTVLRQVTEKQRSVRVVLIREAWMGKGDRDDPWLKRVQRGEIRVRELPPDYRLDILSVYGEGEGGEQAVRIFEVTEDRQVGKEEDMQHGEVWVKCYPLLPQNQGVEAHGG